MKLARNSFVKYLGISLSLLLGNLIMRGTTTAQSTYTAQLTGVITDSSGA